MNLRQFRIFVVRNALSRVDLWSASAENLVLGTGLVESELEYIDQVGNDDTPGPAYGLFQMEKPTYEDIWENYLLARPKFRLRTALLDLAGWDQLRYPPVDELWGNNFYAAAMCRVHYLRVPQPLPAASDAWEMALYWKQHYNTPKGKGVALKALPKFEVACL